MAKSLHDRIDDKYGMSLIEQNVHKRISYQVEIWSRDTGEDLSKTKWHSKKDDAFDEAYQIASRFLTNPNKEV